MTKITLKNLINRLSPFALLTAVLLCFSPYTAAESPPQPGTLVRINTARTDSFIPLFVDRKEGASVTVLLLAGGAGGIGKLGQDGRPTSQNFLIRTSLDFLASGFNVAMMSKPSDMDGLDGARRVSAEHMDDIRRTLTYLKQQFGVPIWVVGTSLGSTSAAQAAIVLRDERLIDGLVLTSSGTNIRIPHAVPNLELKKINVPTLVFHHSLDSCKGTPPAGASSILSGLCSAPIKKLMMVRGGGNPIGDPCFEAHYHGYVGMEKDAVGLIATWINQPVTNIQ